MAPGQLRLRDNDGVGIMMVSMKAAARAFSFSPRLVTVDVG